jgi:AcrR family transcriptional regulator
MSAEPDKIDRREATSEDTKRRILAGARRVLGERPSARFSLEAVAREAGITRLTVYYQFGSKRGLLEALYDDLAEKGHLTSLPSLFRIEDPAQALREFVSLFCRFWASDSDLIRKLRSLAALDNDFQAAIERDRWRRNALRALAGRLIPEQQPPSAGSFDKIVDVLSTLTGFETFDSLRGSGWSVEEIERLVRRLAFSVLNLSDESAER